MKFSEESKIPGKRVFDVEDILKLGYNLEPLECRYCGAEENVVFLQYVGDALCQNCGRWQLENEEGDDDE